MPGFDGTGPIGRGPGTGWGAGFCAVSQPAGNPRPRTGRGFSRRQAGLGRRNRGRGTGWVNAAASATASGDELTALKQQTALLAETLVLINRRIAQIESDGRP